MSFVSKYLHASNIKVIAALAIPLSMVWLFMTAKHEADMQMADIQKELPKSKNATTITVEDYKLTEVDDRNFVHWALSAKSGTMNPGTKDVNLVGVKVRYYDTDGKTLKMALDAPTGLANELTKYIELDGTAKQTVVADSDGGKAKLTAQKVELKEKNRFEATGGVNIVWPQKAQVSADMAAGGLNISDFSNFKLTGNTHALISGN